MKLTKSQKEFIETETKRQFSKLNDSQKKKLATEFRFTIVGCVAILEFIFLGTFFSLLVQDNTFNVLFFVISIVIIICAVIFWLLPVEVRAKLQLKLNIEDNYKKHLKSNNSYYSTKNNDADDLEFDEMNDIWDEMDD